MERSRVVEGLYVDPLAYEGRSREFEVSRNYLRRTYPLAGNRVVTTGFKALKGDIRETDTRRILPSPKMPLETSISSREAGTLAVKKLATTILALTITRQVRILVTQIQSHQEGPDTGDEVGTCA